MTTPSSSRPRRMIRRLVVFLLWGLGVCYLLGVVAGYSWLRYGRDNQHVRLFDVAFVRLGAIRRAVATQHFANAKREFDKKNYQAAYLFYTAGVRQDPDNVPERLNAAHFLRAVGALPLAQTLLEDGLARAPDDRRLIEPTFALLLASGRDRRALELLKQRYGTELAGPNQSLLQRYELEATLALDGAVAAKARLDRHPALANDPLAARVIARIYWETQERLKAIGTLDDYLRGATGTYADYAQLAGWQQASAHLDEAVQTARRAIEKFPDNSSARVLLIDMLVAADPAGPAGPKAVADYVRDFGTKPEGLAELAVLAGRKGWGDLCRSLYEIGANRQNDLNVLALAYSDALAQVSRFRDVQRILSSLEAQAPEEAIALWVQLRQRQVIAAAALGDTDNVHEYARRLAALLARDPDGLEACRRIFQKLGIAEAISELSGRSLSAGAKAEKKA